MKGIIHGYIRGKALVAHGEIHWPRVHGAVGQSLTEFGLHICDQVFGAADGFSGPERAVHALASKSTFAGSQDCVGSFDGRDVIEGSVFVKLGGDFEDSSRGKFMMCSILGRFLADCMLLYLGYGVDWAIVSLLDLENMN